MTTFEQSHGVSGLRPLGAMYAVESMAAPDLRTDAVRDVAASFRAQFGEFDAVAAIHSVDVATIPGPARSLLAGPAAAAGSWVQLIGRMLIVRFDDFAGARRTLVWEPLLADAIASTPMLARPGAGRVAGVIPSRRVPKQLCPVNAALRRFGVAAEEVDFVAFGDLRGHDLRRAAGTVGPVADAHHPRAPLFGDARLLLQGAELDAVARPHPLQAQWYVPGSAEDLITERLVKLDGDVALGPGVAFVATPGLTPGHQTLVLRGPHGIWVVSSNAVAVDCWQPLLSKIPGVRRIAEADGLEVVLPATGAHDPLDLYNSMVLERSLADASREDPRWLSIYPQRELGRRPWQWPLLPTFSPDAFTARS